MDSRMNAWQDTLYDLCFQLDLVNPKAIAHRLHRARNYLSDVCRRDRVDPIAIFNEILKDAEPLAVSDPRRHAQIGTAVFGLLCSGTRWFPAYVAPEPAASPTSSADFTRLCEHAGILCEDLGGVVKSLAAIERDGQYNEADDAEINGFQVKMQQLIARLHAIGVDLRRRRQESPS